MSQNSFLKVHLTDKTKALFLINFINYVNKSALVLNDFSNSIL